jgi:hypothetical protein
MKCRSQRFKFDLPEEWWAAAGMVGFVTYRTAYRHSAAQEHDPPYRRNSRPAARRWRARLREGSHGQLGDSSKVGPACPFGESPYQLRTLPPAHATTTMVLLRGVGRSNEFTGGRSTLVTREVPRIWRRQGTAALMSKTTSIAGVTTRGSVSTCSRRGRFRR